MNLKKPLNAVFVFAMILPLAIEVAYAASSQHRTYRNG